MSSLERATSAARRLADLTSDEEEPAPESEEHEEGPSTVLDAMSGAAGDAAGHVGGLILWKKDKDEPEGIGSDE